MTKYATISFRIMKKNLYNCLWVYIELRVFLPTLLSKAEKTQKGKELKLFLAKTLCSCRTQSFIVRLLITVFQCL